MNTRELVEAVHQHCAVHRSVVKQVLDAYREVKVRTLASGEEVFESGIGKMKVEHRPGRRVRNPRSGEIMDVSASRRVKFTPHKPLTDAVNR